MTASNGLYLRTFLQFFLGITVLSLTLAGCSKHEPPPAQPPAAEVVAITVQPQTVPVVFPFVAQIQSSHQVDVMARVSGFLEKISFKEGEPVKLGQVLFQLDKKPFIAAAEANKAEIGIRESQLWTAKASLDRIKPLAEQNAASKSDLDNATGNYKTAEASLQQSKANYDKSLLDLSYTTITSPVNGVAGQALIREGGYIAAGSTSAKLTYVAKLDPAWVDFSVSQNEQAKMIEEVKSGRIVPPKHERYIVSLELSDGTRYPQTGQLNFADPSFNRETGTFLVRAEIANPKFTLRPGMYVKAILQGANRPNSLLVPQKAVQQSSNGHIVFVANEKGLAEVRPVVAGEWVGNDWIINQGLKAGDKVIVDGFLKLGPGMPVKIVTPEAIKAAQQAQQAKPEQPKTGK